MVVYDTEAGSSVYYMKLRDVLSLLHRACCQVTLLFYQPLHIYKFIKFTH